MLDIDNRNLSPAMPLIDIYAIRMEASNNALLALSKKFSDALSCTVAQGKSASSFGCSNEPLGTASTVYTRGVVERPYYIFGWFDKCVAVDVDHANAPGSLPAEESDAYLAYKAETEVGVRAIIG